jgi:ATP-binding cassette, subfamily F, member 3
MIQLQSISLRRGGHLLLKHCDLTIHPGWHLAIIGNNGCGKSSLFALLTRQLEQDEGSVSVPDNWIIAHMEQEITTLSRSALEYVIDGDHYLRTLQAELTLLDELSHQDNFDHKVIERLSFLHHEMDVIDGYSAEARAGKMLFGLGFSAADFERSVREFSGGWRMRLNLAHTLMCRSDLLLLDEPTNHLDLDALLWLEKWLKAYRGTLILISHDREFLDATIDHIAHIEHSQIHSYRGNYSDFEMQRANVLAQRQSAFEKQQREIVHIQSFITRFKAKATKAKQAQSRIKALEKLEIIAPAHVDSPFSFQFSEPEKLPDPLLRLRNATLGYGKQAIIGDLNLTLTPGTRLGILGPNGAGKSTLTKSLALQLPLLAGECESSPYLEIGYFAQHQLEQLDFDASALLHLSRLSSNESDTTLRSFLGSFDFCGDKVAQAVGQFSGGEKARLALALIVWRRPNLLLLDEPTNHLDIEMRHAVSMALQTFKGAFILVSHDRHLVRCTTEELILVADGIAQPFSGTLDDYEGWLAQYRETQSVADPKQLGVLDSSPPKSSRKEVRKKSAEQRKQTRSIALQIQKLESRIEQLNQKKLCLHEQLAENRIYAAEFKDELKALLRSQTEVEVELATSEQLWISLSEELELLDTDSE